MKFNSRVLGILSLLFVLTILVSSVGAAEYKLTEKDFNNTFKLGIPEGTDFQQDAYSNIAAGNVNFAMKVFDNIGNNTDGVVSVLYFKDSSSDSNLISDVIDDLNNSGEVVEENDNYIIVKNNYDAEWNAPDASTSSDEFWSFIGDLCSSGSDMNFGDGDSNIHLSDDGVNIEDSSANVSFSKNGIYVSDSDGQNVSISSEGVKVSGGSSNETVDVNADVDSVMNSYSEFADYSLCLKNPKKDQLIIICGNDLDLLKQMAESASFK